MLKNSEIPIFMYISSTASERANLDNFNMFIYNKYQISLNQIFFFFFYK